MTDTSKERCEAVAKHLRLHSEVFAADLITALCERVREVEASERRCESKVSELAHKLKDMEDRAFAAEAALAATLSETDAIIEPFARFVNPSPQGAWDGPNIAMGDFQRADRYRRKRLEQMRYKGGADG